MTGIAVLFAVLGGLGGLTGVAALVTSIYQRRKIGAEADKLGVDAGAVISGEALKWMKEAKAEAAEAKAEAKACIEQLVALRDHVDHLERMMRDADLTPPRFRWPLHQTGGPS